MKLLNIKKIAFFFALVVGSVFSASTFAQVTTVYSGTPGILSGTGGNQSISSVTLSGAQTINFSLTGLYSGAGGAPSITFQLRNGATGVGNLVQTLTTSSGTYTGNFSATGAANSLWFVATNPLNFNISNLLLTYGSAPAPTGPSTYNTQASIQNMANSLQRIYSLQNAVLTNSFTYDCTEYGENNVCVSAGGRNTAVGSAGGLNNTSGLVILGYRPAPKYRVGAYADQNLWVNQANMGVALGNNTPLMGLFGVWSENLDGTGTEVKVSAAYGQKNTTMTRGVVGAGTTASEAGVGSSQLNSQGAQVAAKYGFNVMQDVNVAPYAGIRYTKNNMGAYSEQGTSAVTAPLSYGALYTNSTTALLGVGASYKGIAQTTVFASAGYESDTNTGLGTYSGNSSKISGLAPVNFNQNPIKNRPTASLGAAYQIEKNQSIGITGIYRQEAYQSISTTTVLATYTAGF
ncbi:autotransporter outer membrane beta-barrel domain-containing protein [Polynucleobacter sp. UK-Kesae-W10]|uniref:autotransporter outer membrane beta-barrel domain-containing protein n=1 Tax=Polynucleobacter sp. UK-Kesae-W10 TaxID=1819738 RepID=UPI001C0D7CCC|nr:autotransporter outer membrane beta-barrel domain-containing protein [Polynucleobacter sp. UK-Kesae-W10]MBU3578107.1 autotransporter outer membrane beta-barrel domain-containing protein [Polynucleobacter sp. UK-Kesae-W10]